MTLEFFYDVASPYTYLATVRIEAIAADCKAKLVWRPFLLGGVMKATGNRPPAELMPRARYMATDLLRWAKFYGVPMNTVFPIWNSLLPMRVIAGAPDDRVAELSHTLFHAYWVDQKDLTDVATLTGIVGAEAVARANEQATKDKLRANTDEAVARGAFGSPTFFVGEGETAEMYFGQDRLPFVEQALRAR
jgi:2-hydroxychromene-2-carboxylate isomerase